MDDQIHGGIGADADGNIVGKGVNSQNVRIDMSARSQQQLDRMVDVIFGNGFDWDGVVREIRKLESSLTSKITSLEERFDRRIDALERQIANRPPVDASQHLLIAIMIGLLILAIGIGWIVWILASSGAM